MFKRFSIACNINILMIGLAVAGTLLVAGSLIYHHYQSSLDRLVDSSRWVARHDVLTQLGLYFHDSGTLATRLESFLSLGPMVYVGLRDSSGELLAEHERREQHQRQFHFAPLGDSRRVMASDIKAIGDQLHMILPVFSLTNPQQLSQQDRDYGAALSLMGEAKSRVFSGHVYLVADLAALRGALLPYATKVALYGGIFMAIFIVVATTITRRMTAPLRQLEQLASSASRGTLPPPWQVQGAGELRRLSGLLSLVMEELSRHRSRVDTDNKLLSLKVAERTKMLWQRNKELSRVIGEAADAQTQLRQLEHYDSLTVLPNRQLFVAQLETVLATAARQQSQVALLVLDLDNFKRFNESLGHATGDRLLKAVAKRLTYCLRDNPRVARFSPAGEGSELMMARLGSDEFAVVLNNIAAADDASEVAELILAAMHATFRVEGHEVVMTPSMGIALGPEDADSAEELLKLADNAMEHAKKSGRNSYLYYHSAMAISSSHRLRLETDLRKALERAELVLYYQPQVNIRTGKIVGAEALVRWLHPEKGVLSPDQFIPLAEEMGLIIEIGSWVLYQACLDARQLVKQGLAVPKISVNVSPLQFTADFTALVKRALDETGLEPSILQLELTESMLMSDAESSIDTLHELKALGISLAVDDFGTGYSSLNYLSRFPLDELKIERSFIVALNDHTLSSPTSLVAAIIAMGRSLNLQLVAEGVDSPEQLVYLAGEGVDIIQGYLFSRPEPLTELVAQLRDNPFPARLRMLKKTAPPGRATLALVDSQPRR